MLEIGYKLCSEEQAPQELIQYAQRAEDAGWILLPFLFQQLIG